MTFTDPTVADPTRDPAPPQYLPCPACGASTFTRFEVKQHDAWHEAERKRAKRADGLLDRLETFLDAVEGDAASIADGQSVPFPEWMNGVDEAITELRRHAPASAPLILTAGDWNAAAAADDEDHDPASLLPDGTARFPIDAEPGEGLGAVTDPTPDGNDPFREADFPGFREPSPVPGDDDELADEDELPTSPQWGRR